jgi:oligopeptide/dipeptide ABC transporter ATP-binding protein
VGAPTPGAVPDPLARPSGCAFHPRCHRGQPDCTQRHPDLDRDASGRSVRCFHPEA